MLFVNNGKKLLDINCFQHHGPIIYSNTIRVNEAANSFWITIDAELKLKCGQKQN